MGKHRKLIQLLILSVALVIGGYTIFSNFFAKNTTPAVGETAFNFSLYGLDGEQYSLSDFKGKAIVINFWGTFCPPCIEEMPAIQRQYEKWEDSGLVVLGVNLGEELITVQSFVKQNKLTFPILLDKKMQVTSEYKVRLYPTTFFVNRNGKIAAIQEGLMSENFIEQKLMAILNE